MLWTSILYLSLYSRSTHSQTTTRGLEQCRYARLFPDFRDLEEILVKTSPRFINQRKSAVVNQVPQILNILLFTQNISARRH